MSAQRRNAKARKLLEILRCQPDRSIQVGHFIWLMRRAGYSRKTCWKDALRAVENLCGPMPTTNILRDPRRILDKVLVPDAKKVRRARKC